MFGRTQLMPVCLIAEIQMAEIASYFASYYPLCALVISVPFCMNLFVFCTNNKTETKTKTKTPSVLKGLHLKGTSGRGVVKLVSTSVLFCLLQ